MEEKELKTSFKQRFWIVLIAVVMLGSIIASYAAIVINGSSNNGSSSAEAGITEEKKQQYEQEYEDVKAELAKASEKDFERFTRYKSKITAYNEASANGVDVKTEDLREGAGKEITGDNAEYYAYYVGWCADETVFDSSFDSTTDPKAFVRILDGSAGMIEGWKLGVEGMKMDGIRMITIPGTLAYGDKTEICGGTNKPLRFIVMVKEKTAEMTALYEKVERAYLKAEYANYGIDYEELLNMGA